MAIAPSLAQKILAFALALFCPELARMAWIDLKNIELVTVVETSTAASQPSQQLNRFYAVVVSTIALEATGFYLTFGSLPVGAIVIVLSQFWFNLLASIQLYPAKSVPVVSFGILDRQAILAVNAVTAGLLCLWPIQSMRLGLAIALLVLVTLFLTIKYGFPKAE